MCRIFMENFAPVFDNIFMKQQLKKNYSTHLIEKYFAESKNKSTKNIGNVFGYYTERTPEILVHGLR